MLNSADIKAIIDTLKTLSFKICDISLNNKGMLTKINHRLLLSAHSKIDAAIFELLHIQTGD